LGGRGGAMETWATICDTYIEMAQGANKEWTLEG
jgi:hypothetical protein